MDFLWNQLFVRPAYPTAPLDGETVIITGSNAGLGKEAARHCVRLNAKRVILAVRNVQAGEEAAADIETTTKRKGVCEVWKLDLGDYASIKSFAGRVSKELDRVDVLLENAGISTGAKFSLAEDNEITITVNVVSTFLLALLLLPKLQETADKFQVKPRLSIVTSEVHAWTGFAERNADNVFDALNDKETANLGERYMTSKLLEVLSIRHIAPLIRSSKNKDVILNMINPGLCHSSLNRDGNWGVALLKAALARTTEVGSRTLVAGATAGFESHGHYMTNGVVDENAVVPWVRTSEGDKVAGKVWTQLSERLERISPGISENLQ